MLEYRRENPLMPVKALSSQLPVTGMVVAMLAGAVFVTVVELAELFTAEGAHHARAAVGALFRTRYVPVLVDVGIVVLGGGAALRRAHPGGRARDPGPVARLRRPDLEAWLEEGEQALSSPRTGVHLRRGGRRRGRRAARPQLAAPSLSGAPPGVRVLRCRP